VLFVEIIYEVDSFSGEDGEFQRDVGEKGGNGAWNGAERGG
jgi:hypothetical protein